MNTPQRELNFISQFPLSCPPPCPIISVLVYGTMTHLVTQTELQVLAKILPSDSLTASNQTQIFQLYLNNFHLLPLFSIFTATAWRQELPNLYNLF